jgi:hypothetical protein
MDDSAQITVTPYQISRRAVKILGTYIGQNTMLPSIKILQSGKLNLKPFFTETIKLPQAWRRLPNWVGSEDHAACAEKGPQDRAETLSREPLAI